MPICSRSLVNAGRSVQQGTLSSPPWYTHLTLPMDRAIQRTDDDALQSKVAAARKGYFHDDLLPLFCPKPPSPRLPLINIGTYCRVTGVQQLVDKFLAETNKYGRRNIISLGAGSDTRVFPLLQASNGSLDYYELDFPVKTEKKKQTIIANEQLRSIVEKNHQNYHLIGCDLRKIEEYNEHFEPLRSAPAPTLLLSECCLCYLNPERSDNVLRYFRSLVPPEHLSVVLYEPIGLNDEFGRVMAENLAMRGLSLPTIGLYSTLQSQIAHLQKYIGGEPNAVDIATVYQQWIPQPEQERISRLEFLDELEEMLLLMRHYCIAWVFNG